MTLFEGGGRLVQNPSRWATLGAGLVVMSGCGLTLAFSLYSEPIKLRFGLTQERLDMIATMSNLGGNLGVHIGLFYDIFGPRATLGLAALVGCASWLALASAMSPALFPDAAAVPFPLLLVLAFAMGQAQFGGDTAVVATVVAAFPAHRGRAVGLVKAFVGLSSSMAASVRPNPDPIADCFDTTYEVCAALSAAAAALSLGLGLHTRHRYRALRLRAAADAPPGGVHVQ